MLHLLLLGRQRHIVAIEARKACISIFHTNIGLTFKRIRHTFPKPLFLHDTISQQLVVYHPFTFLIRVFFHNALHLVLQPLQTKDLMQQPRPPGARTFAVLEGVSSTQEKQMTPKLITLDVLLSQPLVRRIAINREYVDIEPFRKHKVRTLQQGGAAIDGFGKRIRII